MNKKEIAIKRSKSLCERCHKKDSLKTSVKDGGLVIRCLRCGFER